MASNPLKRGALKFIRGRGCHEEWPREAVSREVRREMTLSSLGWRELYVVVRALWVRIVMTSSSREIECERVPSAMGRRQRKHYLIGVDG